MALVAALAAAACCVYDYNPLAFAGLPDGGGPVVAAEGLAVAAPKTGGLALVDVAQPKAPRLVREVPLRGGGVATGLALQAGVLYAAAQGTGLQIVDVTDVGTASVVAVVTNFTVPNCSASAPAYHDRRRTGVGVGWPVFPPLPPSRVAPTTVVVRGSALYSADPLIGVAQIDVSHPSAPRTVAFLPLEGVVALALTNAADYGVGAVADAERKAYGIAVFVLSAARRRGSLVGAAYAAAGPKQVTGCEVYGDVVAVTSLDEGLVLYDISNMSAPVRRDEKPGALPLPGATLSGRFLFAVYDATATGGSGGFTAYDLLSASSAAVSPIGHSLPYGNMSLGSPRGIAVDGTAAYITYPSGLAVYDVTMIATTGRTIAIAVAFVIVGVLVVVGAVYCWKNCRKPRGRESYTPIDGGTP